MGPGVVVRAYDPARDAEALRACIVEHQDFHRALEPSWPEGQAVLDDYLAYLDRECTVHDGRILVADATSGIVGFACVVASTHGDSPDDPAIFARLHDIFVRQAHRRRGIATALMAEVEAFVRSRGASELRLGVLDRNADARALYRGLGFRDYTRIVTKPL